MTSLRRYALLAALLGAGCLLLAAPGIAGAAVGFGISGFDGALSNRDASVDTQAGSHPYQMTTTIKFSSHRETRLGGANGPDGQLKDLEVNLPAGVVVDPSATPTRCTEAELEAGSGFPACPLSSQVGVAKLSTVASTVNFEPATTFDVAVYNMVASPGAPAVLGFDAIGIYVHISGGVRTGGDYGLSAHLANAIEQEILEATVTLWGVPADHAHDPQRGEVGSEVPGCVELLGGASIGSCPTDAPPKPFLSNPSACSGPLLATVSADSWEHPGVFVEGSYESHDTSVPPKPIGIEDCGALDFSPTIALTPEASSSDSPTGLHVDLHIPQSDAPEGLAEANLKDAVVTLPAGMTVNPSSADGLAGCTAAQIDLEGPGPANCPDAAKIGSVEVDTPLLDHPLPGSIYIAAQGDNPFKSLLAIYIAVDDPRSGVVVKLAGQVEPDPASGQLTTTFTENPQLPFEDFKLDFFGGPRAALTTPSTCGTKTTTTDLTPWSSPEGADATPSDSFQLTSGPNGSPCPRTEAEAPNRPSFEAGTTNPIAGTYSPFVLKLSREDGSQRLTGIDTTLAPGLTGKLAGIAECSDAQIAQAQARSHPEEGILERNAPSCPAASEVGTVTVGAGAGPTPFHTSGHAYLAGPYKGAPLSLAIITPAIAGPFDLGTVVVRTALYVDPETAQIHAVSDPFPTILDGIPLDLRSVALTMDRPNFTLNPTSCDPLAITGAAISSLGQSAPLTTPFQVGGCQALPFKPKLSLKLKGGTRRSKNPALTATLKMPPGGANIASAQVTLPHSAFLEQSHIRKTCSRPALASHTCPANSIYGHAVAISPLLDKPLEGPVYLATGFGYTLPALVADLNGQIEVLLRGKVDTGRANGIRSTFQVVPDAPVSKFTLHMFGGKRGLIVNSENLCGRHAKRKALARFTGQNGKVYDTARTIHRPCKRGQGANGHQGAR